MARQLTGAERLWFLFMGALLATTIAVIAAAWPAHDDGILADLAAPECQTWRDIPRGQLPTVYPDRGEACYSIGAFVYENRAIVRSEREYDAWLRTAGVKNALLLLGTWALLAAGGYALAWSSARSVAALRKRRDPC